MVWKCDVRNEDIALLSNVKLAYSSELGLTSARRSGKEIPKLAVAGGDTVGCLMWSFFCAVQYESHVWLLDF